MGGLGLILPPSVSLFVRLPSSCFPLGCAPYSHVLEVKPVCYSLHRNQTNAVYFQHVANMMIRMKREFPGSQNSIFPVFDTLLLLDRNVDLLTPLATQLTYEGLIDEIYGIQNSESAGSGEGSARWGRCGVSGGFLHHYMTLA